jgi:hypothetical protein
MYAGIIVGVTAVIMTPLQRLPSRQIRALSSIPQTEIEQICCQPFAPSKPLMDSAETMILAELMLPGRGHCLNMGTEPESDVSDKFQHNLVQCRVLCALAGAQ